LKLAGARDWSRPYETVVLAEPVESDGRESYLRCVIEKQNGRRVAWLTGHQGSGNLVSLVRANALLIVPSGVKSLPAGAEIQAWIFDDHAPVFTPG
jgi:molybdopterin molybdotransferase